MRLVDPLFNLYKKIGLLLVEPAQSADGTDTPLAANKKSNNERLEFLGDANSDDYRQRAF